MAIITRLVTVNPAFLQEIKADHLELRQLLHHALAALSRPRGMRIELRPLVDQLGRLRDQLAMHFALEEAFGYFEDALHIEPPLSQRAETLRAEHHDLYCELCRIVDMAEKLFYHESDPPALQRVAERYKRFHYLFERHEAEENRLILEAFSKEMVADD